MEPIDIIGRGLEARDHERISSLSYTPKDLDEAKHTEEKEGN